MLDQQLNPAKAQLSLGLLQRRRVGAVALAAVGLLAIIRLRSSCETPISVGLEVITQSLLVAVWYLVQRKFVNAIARRESYRSDRVLIAFGAALAAVPWLLQILLRLSGQGTGWELVAMSSLSWPTLLAALGAQRRRALGTSVICSGFLTLVVTCSADHSLALLLALLWGGLCLWWLASSNAERAMRCQVNTVVTSHWQRPLIVLAGSVVFALSAWSVAGRFQASQRLRWEVAPTSGGTSIHDEFASGGVGDGDAMVAAREHAASFGAVDSDLMLDSQEASLFDLYSDTFGEPVRKQDVERSVALAPQPDQETTEPNRMSQSDGASSSLTTKRRPSKITKPLDNRATNALLFWIGRPDSHLALERFSSFNGIEWVATTSRTTGAPSDAHALQPIPSGNHTWFAVRGSEPNRHAAFTPFRGELPEAIKYARLKSPLIPTPEGMHCWHIRQVDDASFFQVDKDDNLSMPGRKSVPEYTIVRYIDREIDLETLVKKLGPAANTSDSRWDIVCKIIDSLRKNYRLDRELDTSTVEDPLALFFERRAGNALMFATAASAMLRELGYETRLVTGFVARKENRVGWTKEFAIYPDDTHAWLEVRAGGGDWIPLEPSPGYPQPRYRMSWTYWLKMTFKQLLLGLIALVCSVAFAVWQRAILFDGLCLVSSKLSWMFSDRQRCRLVLMILDRRCQMIGHYRPQHVSPERWYAVLKSAAHPALSQSTHVFFQEANRLCFGNQAALSDAGRRACLTLWNQSTCRWLQQAMRTSATSSEHSPVHPIHCQPVRRPMKGTHPYDR